MQLILVALTLAPGSTGHPQRDRQGSQAVVLSPALKDGTWGDIFGTKSYLEWDCDCLEDEK